MNGWLATNTQIMLEGHFKQACWFWNSDKTDQIYTYDAFTQLASVCLLFQFF
jgi:hypothetical protein